MLPLLELGYNFILEKVLERWKMGNGIVICCLRGQRIEYTSGLYISKKGAGRVAINIKRSGNKKTECDPTVSSLLEKVEDVKIIRGESSLFPPPLQILKEMQSNGQKKEILNLAFSYLPKNPFHLCGQANYGKISNSNTFLSLYIQHNILLGDIANSMLTNIIFSLSQNPNFQMVKKYFF